MDGTLSTKDRSGGKVRWRRVRGSEVTDRSERKEVNDLDV